MSIVVLLCFVVVRICCFDLMVFVSGFLSSIGILV